MCFEVLNVHCRSMFLSFQVLCCCFLDILCNQLMKCLTELITYLLSHGSPINFEGWALRFASVILLLDLRKLGRLFFSNRGEENGYIGSSSIICYLACQEKSFGLIVAVRWEICQVVTCSSHGWGDLEFLVLGSSLLPAPINCQLFWERILFPLSLSEEALGERAASSGYEGWVACRVVVSNAEHLNWDTPSLLYVLMQHIHVSHDLL